jgi:hypothetical protein
MFDENFVDAASFAIHRDAAACPFQSAGPSEGGELTTLIGVHVLRWGEAVDGFVQRHNTNVGLLRVRDAPG